MERRKERVPSPKWLKIAEGLWIGSVLELNSGATETSMKGLVDALEWRLSRQVSQGEFSAIFDAWSLENKVKGEQLQESSREEESSLPLFCQELAKRSLREDDLTLMFGLVVNERNKSLVSQWSSSVQDDQLLSSLRMRLALAEKVFFSLDIEGKGYITVDDVLLLALANKRKSEASPFNLATITADCVRLMNSFGSFSSAYPGTVPLHHFKSLCIKDLEARRLGSSKTVHKDGLNDMTLQKLLIELTEFREKCRAANWGPNQVQNLWTSALEMEFHGEEFESGTWLQLSHFLAVRASRIRWEVLRQGHPIGSDEEIKAYWHAFAKGHSPTQATKPLFSKMERTVFRFVSLLTRLMSSLFPRSFDASLDLYLVGKEEEGEGEGADEESISSDSFQDAEEGVDVEDALDVAEWDLPVPGKDHTEQHLLEGNRDEDDEQFDEENGVAGWTEGAFYIEAFRLFQAEKTEVFGYSEEQAAALWAQASVEDRRVYVDMAKAVRRVPVSSSASQTCEICPCAVFPEQAQFLGEAAELDLEADAPGSPEWIPVDASSMIELIIGRRFSFASTKAVAPPFTRSHSFPRKIIEDEQALFAANKVLAPILREGELGFLGGQHAPLSNKVVKYFFRVDLASSSLLRMDPVDETLNATLSLQGARIGSSVLSHVHDGAREDAHQFIVVPLRGSPWVLVADSSEDMEAWIADISFAIAEEAFRSQLTSSPVEASHSPAHSVRSGLSGLSGLEDAVGLSNQMLERELHAERLARQKPTGAQGKSSLHIHHHHHHQRSGGQSEPSQGSPVLVSPKTPLPPPPRRKPPPPQDDSDSEDDVLRRNLLLSNSSRRAHSGEDGIGSSVVVNLVANSRKAENNKSAPTRRISVDMKTRSSLDSMKMGRDLNHERSGGGEKEKDNEEDDEQLRKLEEAASMLRRIVESGALEGKGES